MTQATQFTIKIDAGNAYTFPKDKFLALFPQSLIGTILEMDPNVTEIPLTQPSVTPIVLHILDILVNREMDFKTHLEDLKLTFPNTLAEASRYLLIPELSLFHHPGINMLIPGTNFEEIMKGNLFPHQYSVEMMWAMKEDYPEYLEFLWQKHPSTFYMNQDILGMYRCVLINNLKYLQKFTTLRRVDLRSQLRACDRDRLLTEYKVVVSSSDQFKDGSELLYYACHLGYTEMCQWLLTIIKTDPNGLVLREILVGHKLPTARLLMQTISYDQSTILRILREILIDLDYKHTWDPTTIQSQTDKYHQAIRLLYEIYGDVLVMYYLNNTLAHFENIATFLDPLDLSRISLQKFMAVSNLFTRPYLVGRYEAISS